MTPKKKYIELKNMVRTKESSMRSRSVPNAQVAWANRELRLVLNENEGFRRLIWEQAVRMDVLLMEVARWRAAANAGGARGMMDDGRDEVMMVYQPANAAVGTENNPIVIGSEEETETGTEDDPIVLE